MCSSPKRTPALNTPLLFSLTDIHSSMRSSHRNPHGTSGLQQWTTTPAHMVWLCRIQPAAGVLRAGPGCFTVFDRTADTQQPVPVYFTLPLNTKHHSMVVYFWVCLLLDHTEVWVILLNQSMLDSNFFERTVSFCSAHYKRAAGCFSCFFFFSFLLLIVFYNQMMCFK